jgi:hypothetical protein
MTDLIARRGFFAVAAICAAGVIGLSAQTQTPVTLQEVEEHVRQAAAPAACGSCSIGSRRIQTTLDLFSQEPREWEALQGWNTPDFSVPGSAFSANGRLLAFGSGLARIHSARWLLIWNPRGDPQSGVRLTAL